MNPEEQLLDTEKHNRLVGIPDSFGYWFSGIMDGEGHFAASYKTKEKTIGEHYWGRYTITGIQISLRWDDYEILNYIKSTLGIGNLYKVNQKGSAPKGMYRIGKTEDLNDLIVPLLEKYPLRSKKAREFPLWRECVGIISRRIAKKKIVHNRATISMEEYERFSLLVEQIKEMRRYPK